MWSIRMEHHSQVGALIFSQVNHFLQVNLRKRLSSSGAPCESLVITSLSQSGEHFPQVF